MNFDYNTQRRNLVLPEYGRHIQKMIQYVKSVPDRGKRNEQVRAVVAVMGNLNPHLRDIVDFRHKLWDHVYIIADFDIDIDSPYPVPAPATFKEKPASIPYQFTPVSIMHYGRNIENMLKAIIDCPDSPEKEAMIAAMAHYMKKQYMTWNKDTVGDDIIFKDIEILSKGRIRVNPALKLMNIQSNNAYQNNQQNNQQNNGNGKNKKYKKKKQKADRTKS
ncbi:MAG: DUF4290 domain-containing protein [Prevotellaceae bacterium]|jgi:hypothetical protein|nr:DUF4290 domain-containing protein [Prevotellaceae bacterium]